MNRFMLNNAKDTYQLIMNSYFSRYDLGSEWALLMKYIKDFKTKIGREPFIFELIVRILRNLNDSIKNQVLDVLYQKDNQWFFHTGQYLLYNFSQWIENFDFRNERSLEEFSLLWWSKFLEFELNGWRSKKTLSYPKKILLELTNNCNLNCVMCGIGKEPYDLEKDMSIKLLESLSETVLPKAELIRLNGLGESTISSSFLDYINILSEIPAQLEIVTNLTSANSQIWNILLEKNTNFLISCDATSAQLFESIRRGAHFKIFRKNLRYIGKNVSNPPQAQLIFTLMELNIKEIKKTVEFAAEMGLGGVIVNVVKSDSSEYGWVSQNIDKIKMEFEQAHVMARSRNIALKLPDHVGKFAIHEGISNLSCQFQCDNPWNEVYVRYNGDLTACNMLNPYLYGNCV
ncbi:MAG: hypothetical protein GF353_15985, partial [Candidatus Lokiarchaeota archaeon]|nr:hypothetical protein [Candidatus Lokiarchaeota archaeon]